MLLRLAVVPILLAACSRPLQAQLETATVLPEAPVPQMHNQADTDGQAAQAERAGGTISGIVTDSAGAAIAAAVVTISHDGSSEIQHVETDSDGVYGLAGVAAGRFTLTIAVPGFATATASGTLAPGQSLTVPTITLAVATATTEVQVGFTRADIAEEELHTEEKQRLIGVFPNFYVTYSNNPVPLSPRQKFSLAGKFLVDPTSFAITGVIAGIQQANNSYSGFGPGPGGYGKRYAASTGTFLDAVLIGNAILPSVLRQDPRYFYKGTGTVKSRILYAMANAVICKGDNGHWQANYSAIGGGIAASAISNFYYPAENRNGVRLTFVNAAIGTGEGALGNVVQEFLFRRFTPHAGKAPSPPGPQTGKQQVSPDGGRPIVESKP